MFDKTQIIILTIILIIHYVVLNPLLKNIVEQYFITSKRPDAKKDDTSFESLGMPSGHAETITILCISLYYYKIISLEACIILIFVVGIQRIISQRHTLEQVIAGILIGLMYSTLYIKYNFSFISVGISLFLVLLYLIILENKITSKMKNIPSYIDNELYYYVNKKQNKAYQYKLLEILTIPFLPHKTLFYDYNSLENGLDRYVENNRDLFDSIDYIVGIKTGGAILGNYLSQQLGKPIYYIKPQHKRYECNFENKHKSNIVIQSILYQFYNEYDDYVMCDGINDNIENKIVLLIDESVESGNTINKSIHYLYKEKKVKKVIPVIYNKNEKFNYMTNDIPLIWPWGYDN